MKTSKPKATAAPKVDLEAITLEFLNETRGWPHLTVLPLKKRGTDVMGLVFFHDKLTVREANIFADAETWRKAKCHTYASLEAIVADGWIID